MGMLIDNGVLSLELMLDCSKIAALNSLPNRSYVVPGLMGANIID